MYDSDLSLLTCSGAKANGNVKYITISDNVPEHWDNLVRIARSSYNHYWYIFHDKDVYSQEDLDKAIEKGRDVNFQVGDIKPKHIHLICFDRGGTSLKAHCERFSEVVPANMVEKAKSSRAILRYLIHKDQPSKYQYDKGLVFSDFLPMFSQAIDDIQVASKFDDYMKLMKMEVTPQEYLEKYKYEINNLNFYQQQAIYKSTFASYGYLLKEK